MYYIYEFSEFEVFSGGFLRHFCGNFEAKIWNQNGCKCPNMTANFQTKIDQPSTYILVNVRVLSAASIRHAYAQL